MVQAGQASTTLRLLAAHIGTAASIRISARSTQIEYDTVSQSLALSVQVVAIGVLSIPLPTVTLGLGTSNFAGASQCFDRECHWCSLFLAQM